MKNALIFAVVIAALTIEAHAQTSAPDPIRCWWRTSAGAVATGEPFDATLTCAVREQEALRTVADESRLAAAAIQLSPFEVLGGSHPADLRSDSHRFLQYHYTVRIIDRDAIGRDARFPDLSIAYRVHTLVNGEWVPGRDRTYVLPGRPVRVLSLVPTEEDDIRDSGDESFARVETLRFRARVLRVGAGALILLGVITAIPVAVRAARRAPRDAEALATHVSRAGAFSAARAELTRVAAERGGGWSAELVSRALTALRVLAAAALARPIAQRALANDDEGVPHAITASAGLLRRKRVALSSATTPIDIDASLAALPAATPASRRDALAAIRDAIQTCTRASYGAAGTFDHATLDQAIDAARDAAGRITVRKR